jgi:hypothetical protein
MKKSVSILMTICVCVWLIFSGNASASYVIVAPETLPYTYDGHTYTDVISVYWNSQGYTKMVYYNPSELTNLRLDYQGGGYSFFVGNTDNDVLYRQYNQQTLNYENQGGIGFAIPINSNSTLTSDYVISSQDVLAYQTEDFNGYQGLGSVSQNEVLMAANILRLNITVDPENSGTIGLSPSGGSYLKDTEVDAAAIPEEGYVFGYWDDGTNHITENPHTFTMDSAKTVTARFKLNLSFPLLDYTPYNVPVFGI